MLLNGYNDSKLWEQMSLKDFGDFADSVEYVNQAEDWADSFCGQWYFADPEKLVIYSGTFGNDHSPGSRMYTYAETFDDSDQFLRTLKSWHKMPIYVD